MNKVRFENLASLFCRQLIILLCCISFSFRAVSQGKDVDYKFGNVTAKDFDVSSSKIVNPDDGAVILYEAGSTRFVGNNLGGFSYVFTYTRRIKILNRNAFHLADVRIRLYSRDNNHAQTLSNVKAVTYNLNDGKVTSINIDKNDIFSEQEDKNHILKTFTMPAVQEGSIIEYTCTMTSPFTFNLPSWQFQDSKYPVLWSEYQVSIPMAKVYTFIRQGQGSFYINKTWEGKEGYTFIHPISKTSIGGQEETVTMTAVTNNYRWVEKDVVPVKIESYGTTPENYVDKIVFQLSAVFDGDTREDVVSTWQQACADFYISTDFLQAASKDHSWITNLPDFKDAEGDLEVAKDIYNYVQDNYVCTDTSNIYKSTDLYEVYKQQKGTVRGINLLLMAILNGKGIHTDPIILSTRENGFINPNYPVFENFNYLICRTKIGDKTYLLDATDPMLGFGNISAKCYNGYARILNESRPDSLYLFADSINESDISTLTLNNDASGKITGSYKYTMGQIKSADLKREIRRTNKNEYFKDVKKSYSFDVDITNSKIDSLDQKGLSVSVQYDLNFKMNDDIVYFNPITPDVTEKENPFKAEQRLFPVEMPYCINKTYVLNMQVPAGYKVDELPKSARVALNDNEGMFQYLVQQNDDHIQLLCKLKLNKSTFEPEDYETLRNFFAFVVEKENEQIVFKKI